MTLLFPGVASSQYTSGYGIGAVLLSSKSAFYYLSIPTQHPLPPTFSTSLLALQQAEVECPVVSVFFPSVEKKEVFVLCVACVVYNYFESTRQVCFEGNPVRRLAGSDQRKTRQIGYL